MTDDDGMPHTTAITVNPALTPAEKAALTARFDGTVLVIGQAAPRPGRHTIMAKLATTLALALAVLGFTVGTAGAVAADHYQSSVDLAADGWSGSAGPTVGHTFKRGHAIKFTTRDFVYGYDAANNPVSMSCAGTVKLYVQLPSHTTWSYRKTLTPNTDCWASWSYAPGATATWRAMYAGAAGTPPKPASHEDLIVKVA